MSKLSKPELSKKNPYWIDKHRYYELKHFCLQYPTWKKAYVSLDGMSKKPEQLLIFVQTGACGDPTAKCAIAKSYYYERIAMLEHTAIVTDKELGSYILIGVTEGCSYDVLRVRHNIPCFKDTYYELYRKFFWLLSQARE